MSANRLLILYLLRGSLDMIWDIIWYDDIWYRSLPDVPCGGIETEQGLDWCFWTTIATLSIVWLENANSFPFADVTTSAVIFREFPHMALHTSKTLSSWHRGPRRHECLWWRVSSRFYSSKNNIWKCWNKSLCVGERF